ncbi:protease modulator HflC [Prosthecobacter algae]|uniref:Protein HflC n=1 Tax=Prosthecobacter algae TaxID=1144682 RepID=A0ABP9NVS1_9BACT
MSEATPSPSRNRLISLRLGLILAVVFSVIASACCFIVSETEHALILRFGKPVRILSAPGLYFRLPMPVEQIVRVDRRLQHADIRLSETLTRDQRNVIVPMFFTWRVADPLLFYTSVRELKQAHIKLDALVTSARNSVLGRHDFTALLMSENQKSPLEKLESEMQALAAGDAAKQLGIELISTGITQIQLPEANTESVFRRMRAERKREATQYRAEGRAKTAEMKAETDKEATRMIADAKRQAEEMRGKAEAEASAIYAAAHGQDPQFYKFLRELQSLRSVVDKNTTVILDTSVAPFHWLKATEPGAVANGSAAPMPSPAPAALDSTP